MVFVDQAAESVAAFDRAVFETGRRVGRLEGAAALGTLVVVVLEVLDEDSAEVVLVADQDPVEAFAADRSYLARVWVYVRVWNSWV